MKRWLGKYLLFAAAAAALLELAGLGYFAVRYGEIFYRVSPANIGANGLAFEERSPAEYLLHPYFGFTRVPRSPFYTGPGPERRSRNNDGFDSDHDYPYKPSDPGEIVVGIFGGSIAGGLVLADPALFRAALQKIPALAGRKITVLPFCREMYKQPQHLLILAYYLSIGQKFDVVVNIDGYNEITAGVHNIVYGFQEGMPNFVGMRSIETAWGMLGRLRRSQLHRTAEELALAKVNSLIKWNRSAFLGSLLDMARIRLAETLKGVMASLSKQEAPLGSNEQEPVFLERGQATTEIAVNLRKVSSVWAKASIEMNELAKKSGALYLHILPPNQYYGNKKFSDDEARVAFGTAGRGAYHIETDGYAELLRRSKELVKNGVRFVDATDEFDDMRVPSYSDACCHYTQTAEERMYGVIAHEIARFTAEAGRFPVGRQE